MKKLKSFLIAAALLFTGCSNIVRNDNSLQPKTQAEIQESIKNRFYQKGYALGYEHGYERAEEVLKEKILAYKKKIEATEAARKSIAVGNVGLEMYKQKLDDGTYKIVYKIDDKNNPALEDLTSIPSISRDDIPLPKPLDADELKLTANSTTTFTAHKDPSLRLMNSAAEIFYFWVPNKEFYRDKLSKAQYIYQIQNDKIKVVFDNKKDGMDFCASIGLNFKEPNLCE